MALQVELDMLLIHYSRLSQPVLEYFSENSIYVYTYLTVSALIQLLIESTIFLH